MTTELPISLNTAMKIDLFEDIKFGDLKDLFTEDTDYNDLCLDIEIEDINNKDLPDWYCSSKITFELNDKKFEKLYEYHNSSAMALYMLEIWECVEIYNAEEEDDE
jgi:hypothetical protein